ncbi:hypothetical protein ACFV0C_22055 [Streptomyces sp. NPDC059568]|uniref:hypothetical protein n=1 Tax=Streptomyces sp. NPDC059568 TaxID=3346868 RepID=UPI00367F4E4C
MSDTGDGVNAPLPRMSQEKAEAWAKHWTESMARTAQAEIAPETATADFGNCTGRNNESADDGRFTLNYNARARLPKERHTEAVRAIRDALKKQGFEIVAYRSDPELKPANLVDAKHPKDHQFVSAGDVTDDLLTLIVNTPCLLPPDAEQQEF